jgi:alpha-1,6-mannosyltransferase
VRSRLSGGDILRQNRATALKICDLTQFYSPASGGVKRYVGEKVAWMRGHRPAWEHVLIVPGPATRVWEDGPARVHEIASPLISQETQYRALLNLTAVSNAIESEGPDLIECSDPYQLAWRAQNTGRSLGVPVVGYYHSHFAEAYVEPAARRLIGNFGSQLVMDLARRYTRHVYNDFSRTLVPSPALADVLRDWGVGNTIVAELGMDGEKFFESDAAADSARVELGISEDTRLLLYIGRLAPEKNVATLLRAFAELHRRRPGRFHLLIAGDGTYRDEVAALRQATGAVTWEPALSAAQLPRFYRAADIFVHPGVLETFGLVTIEAQACGTPVCGIRGSRMDRLVFAGLEDWATENSPAALADAIERMAARDLRALGHIAAGVVAERYDWRVVFERIFAIYDEVIRENRRPP